MSDRKRVLVPGEKPDGTMKLECPQCGCKHFEVEHVYPWTAAGKLRRRQCRNCGWILRTIETPVEDKPK